MFKRNLVSKIVLIVFCLIFLLTGCKEKSNYTYLFGQNDLFTKTILEYNSDLKLKKSDKTTKDNIYYQVKGGNLAECMDVQVMKALDSEKDLSFYPEILVTTVIALDKDQTDSDIKGWEDLKNSDLTVSIEGNGILQRSLIGSIAYGYQGENYTEKTAISYLNYLKTNNRLKFKDSNCPAQICFDIDVIKLNKSGRNMEIVVPEEGTLSFQIGILSLHNKPEIPEEDLLDAGFRLVDGSISAKYYGENTNYSSASEVMDYNKFNEVTSDATRDIRRYVQHVRLLSSADGREHILFFIGAIILILLWTASALFRSYRKDVRHWMMLISALSTGWMLISLLKYQLPVNFASRMCWYGYYIPLLCLPLLLLYISLVIDKPDNEKKLPKWFYFVYSLCPALILLVFTNDWHHLVFKFDNNMFSDDNYSYGHIYYIIFAYCILTFLTATFMLLFKCIKLPKKYAFIMPAIVAVLMITYNSAYVSGTLFAHESNYSFVVCILVILFAESVLQTGIIPVNTHYKDLFSAEPLHMQLINKQGETVMSADNTTPLDSAIISRLTDSDNCIMNKDRDTLIHSFRIHGGTAVWQENIKKFNEIQDEIEISIQKLKSSNALLQKEHRVQKEKSVAEVKKHLLTMLEEDIGRKNQMLTAAIEELPEDESKWESHIAYITLLLCYIKRRSNLFFLAQEDSQMSCTELTVYLDELSEFAAYSGIKSLVRCEDIEKVYVKNATLYYDFYFTALSWAVKQSRATIIGRLDKNERDITFSLLSSAPTDTLNIPDNIYESAEECNTDIQFRSIEESYGIYLISSAERGI